MINQSDIPQARKRLLALADQLQAQGAKVMATEITEIVDTLMIRRPGSNLRSRSCRKGTPEIAAQIRDYRAKFPGRAQMDIALEFKVNQGFVSKALAGTL